MSACKTPNQILQMNDIPDRHIRDLPSNASYPPSSQYTLQWLAANDAMFQNFIRYAYPNNSDAAFVSHHKAKPSDLLLHYNYGAAAVKHWGKNQDILCNCENLPCPHELGPDSVEANLKDMSPTTNVGGRTITTDKLAGARTQGTQQQPAGNGDGTGLMAGMDSQQPVWDEDDVMLFFWGNSTHAVERRAKEERERNEKIYKWRTGTVI